MVGRVLSRIRLKGRIQSALLERHRCDPVTGCAKVALLDHSRPLTIDTHQQNLRQSIENPQEYWGAVAENTIWHKKFDKVLDNSNSPFTKWFPGGELSLCYNAVDRHVDEGHASETAIIWESPITNKKKKLTYGELQDEVARMAGLLARLGVSRGDRVLIYMPMVAESLIAMLGVVRLGAVHSVVFGGFAAKELAVRIKHAQPKVIISASCGLEPNRLIKYKPNVDEAVRLAGVEVKNVVLQRDEWSADLQPGDLVWQDVMSGSPAHDCVPVESNDPLYILYTSGTTGEPKGVVHPTGGHAVVNKWTMSALYGMAPGEVWWAASDIGWIVGHEYICYSPLLNRNTTIVYEGKPVGTPNAAQFFRVIEEHKVSGMFTAPTAIRAIQREDPNGKTFGHHDLSSLKYLFVAGEHCDHGTRLWAEDKFKVPVLNNWWQTETGHAITANSVGLGNSLTPPKDTGGKAVPGWDIHILKEDGSEAGVDEMGRIVCKLPMPPGCMTSLHQAEQRFKDTYFKRFPGFYDTMDAGSKDADGYIKILARDDDVINVAGHRLSTSGLEEVLLTHPSVADAAVVGVDDPLKGQIPLGLVVARPDAPDNLEAELVRKVRDDLGAVAAFKIVGRVKVLPRTRSGKTARATIADLANGKEVKIPPTIEDPSVYVEIKQVLVSLGYAVGAPDPK